MAIRNIFMGAVGAVTLIALLPISAGHKIRNQLAYHLLNTGQFGAAQKIYAYNMKFKDPLATNNYHALRLNKHMSDPDIDKDFLKAVKKEAKLGFDQVMRQTGQAAASYNAGMMNYRCRTKTGCYRSGLRYLSAAAAAGDELSRDAHDYMNARGKGEKVWRTGLKTLADRGNAWAAHKYAEERRHDKNKGDYLKYAEIGAKGGIADAQNFLADRIENLKHEIYWHEKAATNPLNRSLTSAVALGRLAEERGDYKEARRWYNLAMEPRGPFGYDLIIRPDGIRWRGMQTSREGVANTPNWAGYHKARLQIEGLGGRKDLKGAVKSLEVAGDDFADAGFMRRQILAGNDPYDPDMTGPDSIAFNLERFDQASNSLYKKLRPLFENGSLRFVTTVELTKWEAYVARLEGQNDKKHREAKSALNRCNVGYSCFHIEKPVRLPDDMFGARSTVFIVDKSVALAEQSKSHNKYLYEKDL